MVKEPLTIEDEAIRVHLILQCDNCDWHTEDYLKGDALALQHSKDTGHDIRGEYGLAITIYGSGPKPVPAASKEGTET